MRYSIRGMVQVSGVTYRIVRLRAGEYDIVRVLDDAHVGMFSLGNGHHAHFEGRPVEVVKAVARAALQRGRTSWVAHVI